MIYTRKNPSPEYTKAIALGKEFHRTHKTFTGKHCFQSYLRLRSLVVETEAKTLLDYGCGKGAQFAEQDIPMLNHVDDEVKTRFTTWREALDVDSITGYEPCWPAYEQLPTGRFDGVYTTDVLEHVPPSDQPWVVDELFSFANKFVFATIALFPGKKVMSDGSLAHLTIKPLDWWVRLWVETGMRHPHVRWSVRLEVEVPPLTHRRFEGQGDTWSELPPWWKIWKPTQVEELSPKQRAELEIIARMQQAPVDLPDFEKTE